MNKTIIISAGGTGGHIFPALAIAKQLQNSYKIIWVGAKTGLENTLIPQHGFLLETVTVAGVRNKGLLRKLLLPFTLLRAHLECLKILLKHRPAIVVGFGGYATFPITLTAKLLFKPVVIHEQNSVAGLTNRILAKVANKVLVAFPAVLAGSKTLLVGNPVRQEIIAAFQNKDISSEDVAGLRVLIIGGSLGAKALNDNVPLALAKLGNKVAEVTHQVGRSEIEPIAEIYRQHKVNVKVVNFVEDMAAAYTNADLIICRAGASTVAEVACAGIAAIFVPYPYAVDDHQTVNTRQLVAAGAAQLLPQTNLTPDSLAEIIRNLSHTQCQAMGQKARSISIIDSTERICQQIIEQIK